MPKKKAKGRPRLQRVSVRAERREPVDWDRFAWALLQYTKLISENNGQPGRKQTRRDAP